MRRYLPICLAAHRSASSHVLFGFVVGNATNWGRDEIADAHHELSKQEEGLEYVEGLGCWVKTLDELLIALQLEDYRDVFHQHSVNLESLQMMHDEDLLDIGIAHSVVKMLATELVLGCDYDPVTKELIRPPRPSTHSAARLGSKEECIFETEYKALDGYVCLEMDKPHYSDFSFGMADSKKK